VVVDKPKAALLRVPELEIDRGVRLAFAGLNVSRFRESDGDEYNIQLALPRGERATLEQWPKLQVQALNGSYMPIAQVARLEFESALPVIQRYNRERSIPLRPSRARALT